MAKTKEKSIDPFAAREPTVEKPTVGEPTVGEPTVGEPTVEEPTVAARETIAGRGTSGGINMQVEHGRTVKLGSGEYVGPLGDFTLRDMPESKYGEKKQFTMPAQSAQKQADDLISSGVANYSGKVSVIVHNTKMELKNDKSPADAD